MSLKTTKRKETKSLDPAFDGGAPPLEFVENDATTVAVENPHVEEPAPRAPVAVGRSLEISCAADVCMELLTDKLKFLEYEKEFCKKKKPYRKTLGRAYFASSLPGNEQFHYFSNLAAWLLTLGGVDTPAPKPEEEPQAVCGNLIAAAQKLGFSKPGYAAVKLTLGSGKEVCGFLEGLVDYVLERRRFAYKMPTYTGEVAVEDTEADDDGGGMEGADEMAGPAMDDYDEEEYMDTGGPPVAAGGMTQEQRVERQGLVSKVDPTMWKLELERVAPRLRITIAADARDWRNHLDEARNLHQTITVSWPESKAALERLHSELSGALDKLQSREKFLNEQFDNLMQQYRAARVHLTDAQESYNKRTENVSDRNSELSRITEQIEEMKHVLDERGTSIGDATPVARIKAAIRRLEEELAEMAVKVGVVSSTLLQLSLSNKRLMQSQAAQLSDDDD